MKDSRPLWAVLLVLAAGAVGLLITQLERKDVQIPVPASGKAAANAWYGVERLLGKMGVEATSAPGVRELPPSSHVVLLFARGQTSGQTEELLAWVASGGHLIAAMDPRFLRDAADDEEHEFEPEDDPIVAALGLQRSEPRLPLPDPILVVPPQGGEPLEVDAPNVSVLLGEETTCLWTDTAMTPVEHCALASFHRAPYGDGWITLLPSADFLDNDRLDEHDHARLIWALVQREGPPAGALIIYRDQPPSLWALLGQHVWPVLVAGALLLVGWLWATLPRFGPILGEPEPARRSLIEHVVAAGELLWRHGHQDLLLKSARRQVLRKTLGLGADGRAGLAVIEAVSAETGASHDEVREALFGGGGGDPDLFLRAVAGLMRLRRGARKPHSAQGSS